MDFGLYDKAAIVFGGADGIGAAIVQSLHTEGAGVAIADLNKERSDSLAKSMGPLVVSIPCDVSNKGEIVAAVKSAATQFGGLHILVLSVGLTLPDRLEDITDADIERTFEVNMRSHIWAAQAALPKMREAGYGRIVLIGSGSGIKGSGGLMLYSASKFFLRGLTQAMGIELGPTGVTANIVCPSDVYPEGDRPAGSWTNEKLICTSCRKENAVDLDGVREARIARTPLQRSCSAQDVANVVTFLCSSQASFITAQTIAVNGGLLPT
ncbi:MAG: SDR family oxidoreductase [Phycisphaerae bacterium]|nr:SDR family oxidoreductase [Phycisphaerae bacterium]